MERTTSSLFSLKKKYLGSIPTSAIIIILVLALSISIAMQFRGRQPSPELTESQSLQAKKELYLITLRTLTEVPDEDPVMAEVDNAEQVKNEPFLRRAENGDVVLAFKRAKWAVLYRPRTRQIIDTTQITIEPNPSAALTPKNGAIVLPSPWVSPEPVGVPAVQEGVPAPLPPNPELVQPAN